MKGPDPRADPVPLERIPELLRAGAAELHARRFWHAHESWETAWHALRGAGREAEAEYLQGMILVAAALENATRGKEDGFKRQLAEGLHKLLAHPDAAAALGLVAPRAWETAVVRLYADACRRHEWARWNEGGWSAPALELR